MKPRATLAFALALAQTFNLAASPSSDAAGKKRPEAPINGKRVISLVPVDEISIELPDQTRYSFGQNFEASLLSELQKSERFVVTQQERVSAKDRLPPPPGG